MKGNNQAKIRIAHLINPFVAPKGSDLVTAQPITFETMRRARSAAKQAKVELYSAQFESDREAVPDGFIPTPNLEQRVTDLGNFDQPRSYPLISELLQRLHDATSATYLVYTNVDIALQPHFYDRCAEIIREGHDAFIINRRRIPAHYTQIDQIEEMYQEKGLPHPGFDCFVFHRDLLPKMHLEGICIGVPFIGITLSQNVFAYARNPKVFEHEHLTQHIGLEIFKKRAPREYFHHNKKAFWKNIQAMDKDLDIRKFPWFEKWLPFRLLKWGLNPSIPIKLALKLEWRRILGR